MNRTENIERITTMLNDLTDNQIIYIMTFMENIFGMDGES